MRKLLFLTFSLTLCTLSFAGATKRYLQEVTATTSAAPIDLTLTNETTVDAVYCPNFATIVSQYPGNSLSNLTSPNCTGFLPLDNVTTPNTTLYSMMSDFLTREEVGIIAVEQFISP